MAISNEGAGRLKAFIELVKPELTGLTVMTGVVAYLFAKGAPYDVAGAITVGVAMLMVGGCAAALNQVLEKRHDVQMKRTERRPLPSGRIREVEALLVGGLAGIAGLAGLWWQFNLLSASLAAATLITYLGIYTPLKRRSAWNTVVGAIPGALPTLIGWTAAEGTITTPGWLFFTVLVLWQFPHFFSLAWMYRNDYARAGYRMLPILDDLQGSRTNLANLLSIVLLIGVTSTFSWAGFTGPIFLGIAALAGCAFFAVAWIVRKQQRTADTVSVGRIPRKLFLASLLYLPTILLSALLDKS